MEATCMLHDSQLCVRSKLELFLRLWTVRRNYEQLRPFGGETSAEQMRFHLAHLEIAWARVVEFQRALGLDQIHFAPREEFEKIYVVTGFAQREFENPDNTLLDVKLSWETYTRGLRRLSYNLNPFDFGETCLHCYRAILELRRPWVLPTNVIPLEPSQLAKLNVALQPREEAESHFSESGRSKYSPGGKSSYPRK